MIDPSIVKWMYASAAKYFSDFAQTNNIPFYLNSYTGDGYWAEFRFDGPTVEDSTIGTFNLTCDINILITAFTCNDDYLILKLAGKFASAFNNNICVYKYGDEDDDDQTLVGTLQLYPSERNIIDVVHYGIISSESKQKRSSVEAKYTMKW
jgi:hypothetical protein